MLTYFCGDHINKPVVMIAFGDSEYYDNISLPTSQYDGKHIKEAYMYKYLRNLKKNLNVLLFIGLLTLRKTLSFGLALLLGLALLKL